jgi:hypothetical protein
MKSFQTLRDLATNLSTNTSTANQTLMGQFVNDAHRYLLQKYFFNEASTTILTVSQQQFYDLPFDFSKNKTDTITTGDLKWTPTEILTRADWDRLNVFPYYADFPSNYFIWNNKQLGFWPIPSTAGNTITYNYKRRPTELTITDYTTGTVSATINSPTITGSGTGFVANYLPTAGSVLNLNLWLKITPPSGDGNWYQISSLDSATSLTLVNDYTGGTTSGASFTIGQMPLLLEDFHDLLVYRPLMIYFSSINPDSNKASEFTNLYNEGIKSLDSYAGSKTVNVNLRTYINTNNPNRYVQDIT